jgi:hypothetical protein
MTQPIIDPEEITLLETVPEDDDIQHAICLVCYPTLEPTMVSLCGVLADGDILIGDSEVTDPCTACCKIMQCPKCGQEFI